MPKRKKSPPITGVSSDPESKLMVQKSRPLEALWRSELTLAEFKILDTYLSRIDSRKPDKRLVRFEKGELEKLLGVTKINMSELKERMKHLMGNVVEVLDPTAKRGFKLVTLFETAECEYDENGQWQVNLECTQKAMKYFFNIDTLGYFRYKLRAITSIQSRYSYIMFVYLESNRFRKKWEVPVDELKRILKCENEEYCREFKRFNDRLLKRCHKELTEKTECKYTYEPVKKGRAVVAIRFTLDTLKDLEPVVDPDQYSLDEYRPDSSESTPGTPAKRRDKICMGFDADIFAEFSDAELELLKDLAWPKKSYDDVERYKLHADLDTACQLATSDYLRRMIRVAKSRGAKNLFAYVQKMILNDGSTRS